MITASLLTVAMLGAAGLPPDALVVSARIEADTLTVGPSYDLVVVLHWSDGVSASAAGMPAPVLQIEAPRRVRLDGKVLRSHGELSQNEFLQAPYERLAKENPTRIGFTLRRAPKPDDVFSLNVLAYVELDGKKHFARRRVTIPVAPGAVSSAAAPDKSNWGVEKTLNIGDKAATFTLPHADGSKVSLADFRGKKNVIVTTYRAFW